MCEENRKGVFVRFFKEEDHVECFRNGNIRMMSMGYYKDWEAKDDGSMRMDHAENSTHVYNHDESGIIELDQPLGKEGFDRIKLNLDSGTFGPTFIGNPISDKTTKIASFTVIVQEDILDGKLSTAINEKVKNLGKYYCLILSNDKLFKRLGKKANELNIEPLIFAPIKYVDVNTYNGYYGPYRKPNEYQWQNECRLAFARDEEDPFWFNIESLRDITIWGNTSDLLEGSVIGEQIQIPNFKR